MLNTCKSNGKPHFGEVESGGRVSNTLIPALEKGTTGGNAG